MKFQKFQQSLQLEKVPQQYSLLLQALWYDAKGDWEKAHQLAQEDNTADGALLHAYLHRKEGDEGNAQYWYNRANKKFSLLTLEKEWEEIVKALLKK